MADPSRFVQSYDFSAFQENNPNTPLPGVQVDVQLADIQTSTTELVNALKDVRRSDGALVNEIVTEDSLAPGLLESLTAQTGADAVEADRIRAETAADEAEASAAILASVAELIEEGGYYLDDGSITEAATSAFDDGSIA